MARPKRPEAAAKPTEIARQSIISLKGTSEYAHWLTDFSRTTHISQAVLVRLGLAKLAEQYEFIPPPEL